MLSPIGNPYMDSETGMGLGIAMGVGIGVALGVALSSEGQEDDE